MAIVRVSSFVSTGSAINLNLGFVPSYIRLMDSAIIASGSGLGISEWYSNMPNGTAFAQTLTLGVPTFSVLGSNGFTPYQTPDSLLYTPTNMVSYGGTNITITGITKASQAVITATNPFTAADVGVTTVTFHGIVGMTQLNTLSGLVTAVGGGTSFTVNINTTSFTTYVSGGIANVITGEPPVTVSGFQVYNTPLLNNGSIGITLGSAICGSIGDVMNYYAFLDADFTSQ